ncbi:OmpA family protein [Mycobacterium sp. E787]|uniref:channel-forming protein ArfA/OmpATb n=1 Tax=Mycobacterium sp. E787 TaxID=1834150 RepID=UPI0009EDE5E8|nr:OmpA family protein [Mycobacterium sp. E787]
MTEGAIVGIGTDLRQVPADTDSRPAPELHRRSPGLPWLIAVALIPLFIAAIGYGGCARPRSAHAPPAGAPTSASAARKLSLSPLSITRSGNDLTLSGDFPDDSAKAALLRALNGSLPPGVNIVDQIHINPNIDALDFSKAGPIFKDSASIPDFSLMVRGDTITVAGTASSQEQNNVVHQEAVRTWSKLNVVDNLVIRGPVAPPVPPVAPAAVQCTDLRGAIIAVTGGPIEFANDGVSLTPADEPVLTQVSDKLKACPMARVTLNGYADNSGVEAINIPLSTQRAQKVADFLVAHGVAGTQLVVKGLGSANPIAPNDTAEGRAKNRRVEIVVS